jgi:acyl-CoA synthetase (AMP-forming)/AMP-acid ligase II
MAETTLLIAGGTPGRTVVMAVDAAALDEQRIEAPAGLSSRTVSLVGCGRAWRKNEVAIVEPATATRATPNQVGEIWIRGPSVAGGYWGQPELTCEVFGARLAGPNQNDARTWLRTGDLGFVRDGNLFIAGRLKDLVIVRGRNHYPQDIELTVERSHRALAIGRAAAFSVPDAMTEQLIIVAEVDFAARTCADQKEIVACVVRAVTEAHAIAPKHVHIVAPGRLPVTSSGKVQRMKARKLFLEGALKEFCERRPTAGVEAPSGGPGLDDQLRAYTCAAKSLP